MPKQEIKDIWIDADYLIYNCTESKVNKTGGFAKKKGNSLQKSKFKTSLKPFKEKFNKLISDLEQDIAIETICEPFKLGETYLVFTGHKNFRDKLYPAYKGNRVSLEKSPEFKRLRKWALKNFLVFDKFEADDICSYMARKGHLVVSADKDVRNSSEGIYFNPHHMHRTIVKTTEEQARRFTLIQTLTGDSTDNIPALPKEKGNDMIDGIPRTDGTRKPFKVTEAIATKLLDEFGWDDDGVLAIFKDKGFGEKERTLNRRLIGMHQVSLKKNGKWKLKLWNP